jgi:hypothetical protein
MTSQQPDEVRRSFGAMLMLGAVLGDVHPADAVVVAEWAGALLGRQEDQ